jgi:hypothetical protein
VLDLQTKRAVNFKILEREGSRKKSGGINPRR